MKICHTLCFHLLSVSNLYLAFFYWLVPPTISPGVADMSQHGVYMTQVLKFRILVHKENALLELAWQGEGGPTESNTDTGVMANGMGVLALQA